ncbi:DUF4878 domain-containing protein [Mycobacterium koreense]|uniref:Uncharacterized protein n=1 Tax=Mycolicibacillus koreensis TaxID=1069220 RepID=A0A7I7SDT9_9MYCO|nr:DUF4878 domain-containing protein [Mycolicibacillus koreensis]MCV7249027.1 DUF4878 domain-containing protein [Mycolicibacillus koreensis]ODR08522.1 hypothetical protein BHQ15_08540 [Mycolicibacillus koreensis]OSC34081.1 hypothetical protein B8W67_07955 [Mycolicibacillus koreensis]BBY54541.1 hypothetical protein MKOR_17920 [Mycolicibacillus koreensis]
MTIGPDGYQVPNPMGQPPQPPGSASWDPTQMAYPPAPPAYPDPQAYPGPQAPPPGGGWPGMEGQPPGAPYGPPPQRSRKGLYIGLGIGGVALLVVIAVVLVIALSGGSSKDTTGGEAMTNYLQALAAGDAEKALSYGADQPGSKEFLTDEILKKQIEKMPITDITILNDDTKSMIGLGRVHVSAKFGEKTSDETISMKKSDKEWKLEQAAIKLEPSTSSNKEAQKTLTLFGKEVGDATFYVFPGWLDLGSNNPNLKVTFDPLLLNGLGYSSFYNLNIKYDVSEQGNKAVKDGMKSALAKCTTTHELAPSGCPQYVSRSEAAENTVNWGMPDLSPIKTDLFSEYDLTLRFSGEVDWPLTAKKRDGSDVSGTVTTYISGTADLSTSPPTVTIR